MPSLNSPIKGTRIYAGEKIQLDSYSALKEGNVRGVPAIINETLMLIPSDKRKKWFSTMEFYWVYHPHLRSGPCAGRFSQHKINFLVFFFSFFGELSVLFCSDLAMFVFCDCLV